MTIYQTGIIYCYTNRETGKRYIGQTIHPTQRHRNHIHEAFKKNTEYYFHRSLRAHGIDAFDYVVLEEDIVRSNLNDRENYYIDLYNTLWPNGYNQCLANSLDETAIQKISETKKRQLSSLSDDERKALTTGMVAKNIRSKRSEETKRKMSESAKKYLAENPRRMSEETMKKISESVKKARLEKKWSTKKKEGTEAPS